MPFSKMTAAQQMTLAAIAYTDDSSDNPTDMPPQSEPSCKATTGLMANPMTMQQARIGIWPGGQCWPMKISRI